MMTPWEKLERVVLLVAVFVLLTDLFIGDPIDFCLFLDK